MTKMSNQCWWISDIFPFFITLSKMTTMSAAKSCWRLSQLLNASQMFHMIQIFEMSKRLMSYLYAKRMGCQLVRNYFCCVRKVPQILRLLTCKARWIKKSMKKCLKISNKGIRALKRICINFMSTSEITKIWLRLKKSLR